LCASDTLVCRSDTNGWRRASPSGARLRRAPCPCPPRGGHVLKALLTGLCALVLCATPVAAQAASPDVGVQLARHLETVRNDTSVIRFFDEHRWLLTHPRYSKEAKLQLRIAKRSLAARTRATVARRREAQRLRLMASIARSPRKAICHVFGEYCRQALEVARCESGYQTAAQNGEYRGLFQMGSSARHLFGHGAGALAQARAAHRYFLRSGRDWSPWSCKPWS
jgi:hypothetical protein